MRERQKVSPETMDCLVGFRLIPLYVEMSTSKRDHFALFPFASDFVGKRTWNTMLNTLTSR